MKTKSFIYTLLMMVMFSLLPTGCNDDDDFMNTTPDDDKVHWTIGVSLPGAVHGETRAFGDPNTDDGTGTDGYYEFNDLYVAVFAEIGGVSYLEEFVRAEGAKSDESTTYEPTWTELIKFGTLESHLARPTGHAACTLSPTTRAWQWDSARRDSWLAVLWQMGPTTMYTGTA